MASVRRSAPLLLVGLLSLVGLSACGDGASTPETFTGQHDAPVIRIEIDEPGWSVATNGFLPKPGEVEIQFVNIRDSAVEIGIFPRPAGYALGEPVPGHVDTVHEQSLAAGADEQVTITFDEGGDYAVLVDPPTASTTDTRRFGGGFTIADS